jgi:hypothetical protein
MPPSAGTVHNGANGPITSYVRPRFPDGVGPRCELKYNRVPSGLSAGPAISENGCPGASITGLMAPLAVIAMIDQLHHEVIGITRAADVVQHADVRMVERRDGPRLALEPRADFRAGREMLRQHLDGNVAPEPRIAGAIHLAHPAGAERRHDFVGAEAGSGGKRGNRHRAILAVGSGSSQALLTSACAESWPACTRTLVRAAR